MSLVSFPRLSTTRLDKAPTAPFHWKHVIQYVALEAGGWRPEWSGREYLHDSEGRQIFDGCAAIWRKAAVPDYPPPAWKRGRS